jgi:CheY-like chemotaxis protein
MAVVMVVDDEPEVLDVLSSIMSRAGHSTVKASSGVAALDLLDSGAAVDVLLTDVMMPELNGFNLARIARMRRPSLKVLFLTGFYDLALTLRDPLSEIGKLLQKPILPSELTKAVAEAIELPQ